MLGAQTCKQISAPEYHFVAFSEGIVHEWKLSSFIEAKGESLLDSGAMELTFPSPLTCMLMDLGIAVGSPA